MRAESWDKPDPECWCEYVDIGVGNQKVHEHDECPRCVESHGPPVLENPHKILLAGDTHGDAHHVRTLIQSAKKHDADAVFVLGDFGIWDHMDDGRFTSAVSKFAAQSEIPVCFLPGNHDNYDLLFQWEAEGHRTEDGFNHIKPYLFYSPRGHRWTWNGVRFMSLGGAYSIDKENRILGDARRLRAAEAKKESGHTLTRREVDFLKTRQRSWWHQEEISQEELDYALRPGEVDVLLTHDKPRLAVPDWNRKDIPECWENQQAIQDVVDAKRPDLLVHGHLHYAYDQWLPNGTWVKGLDCDPEASRYSGGSGDNAASYGLLELERDIDDQGERGMRFTWAGKTLSGWSDANERNFKKDKEVCDGTE